MGLRDKFSRLSDQFRGDARATLRCKSKHTDERVLSVLRDNRKRGCSYKRLSSIYNIPVGTIEGWCSGWNRGHLLMIVEKE